MLKGKIEFEGKTYLDVEMAIDEAKKEILRTLKIGGSGITSGFRRFRRRDRIGDGNYSFEIGDKSLFLELKMEKYKVGLTGHTRFFTVTDEKGNEFLATEFYDENTQSSDWGIYNKPLGAYNPYVEEHKIDEQQRKEIIKAVLNSRKD